MDRPLGLSLLAGAAAGILYALTLPLGGAFLIYAALVPLYVAGFNQGNRSALIATGLATLSAFLLGGVGAGLVFFLFLGVPALLFIHKVLLWREDEQGREWYPVALALTSLAFYAVIAFLLFAYSHADSGGLAVYLMSQVDAMPPTETQDTLRSIITHWPFLVFSMAAWMWLLMHYAMAVLANSILTSKNKVIRASLALARFQAPLALLLFLLASAGLSFLGNDEVRFIGKTLFIILLFPYFLSGICLLHRVSFNWPGRGFALFALYLLMAITFWPLLAVGCAGLIEQLFLLGKGPAEKR